MGVTWEWCHEHNTTTLTDGDELLACGCEIHPSSRPTKDDA